MNYNENFPYGRVWKGTYREKTFSVGSANAANAFGLFDMHGNAWEWCLDYWHENYGGLVSSAPTDGSAWLSGGDSDKRVVRGGSWINFADFCRSAFRYRYAPGAHYYIIGFRVVVSARM